MTELEKLLVPVKTLLSVRSATLALNRASLTVPADNWEALSPVRLAPDPLKPVAVTVPAVKLPEASRLTIVLTVLALAAALAAEAPAATLAAVWPPTLETTVAPWVPV